MHKKCPYDFNLKNKETEKEIKKKRRKREF